jgi:hypothetical protein
VAPSFETSGEVTGFGEIRVAKIVFECELDLGIRSGILLRVGVVVVVVVAMLGD